MTNKNNKKKSVVAKLFKLYQWFSLVYTVVSFLKIRGFKKENDLKLVGDAIDRIARRKEGAEHADKVVAIDGTEMYIKYNPYFHLFLNAMGSIASVITGTTEVVVDDHYRNFSKEVQFATLCHEMGHYKLQHRPSATYQFDRIKAIWHNEVLPMELEADEYAASIVGPAAMAYALCQLGKIKGVSKKEVYLRVKNLKGKQEELYAKANRYQSLHSTYTHKEYMEWYNYYTFCIQNLEQEEESLKNNLKTIAKKQEIFKNYIGRYIAPFIRPIAKWVISKYSK